jgi:hypothetical protein
MRKIRLLVLQEVSLPTIDYAVVIKEIIRRPLNPQQGADILELRLGIKVLDALDRADEVLELEETEWQHLKDKTLNMQWNVIDERIVKFVDDILGATGKLDMMYTVTESPTRDGMGRLGVPT